jgi:hypothetical protein
MNRARIRSYLYLLALAVLVTAFFTTRGYLGQHWPVYFGACAVAATALALLYARSLSAELALRQWRKEASAIDPERIDRGTAEGQRQWLVWLYARGDYGEAAEYAATLPDEVLRSAPCERLADAVRRRRPEAARRLYRAAIEQYMCDGRQATGSGEGLMAAEGAKRVEEKLRKIKG